MGIEIRIVEMIGIGFGWEGFVAVVAVAAAAVAAVIIIIIIQGWIKRWRFGFIP